MDKSKIVKFILGTILVIYTGFFIVISSNYYQLEEEKKMILTSEQIKKFEEDIANGKEVEIDEYLESNTGNYSNKFSRGASKISNKLETVFQTTLKYVFKQIANKIDKN